MVRARRECVVSGRSATKTETVRQVKSTKRCEAVLNHYAYAQFTIIRARVVAITTDNFTIELLTKKLYFSIVTHLSHGMPSFTSRFLGLVLPNPDHDCNTMMFLSSLSLARGQSFSKRKKVDGVTHVTKAHQLSKIR